METSRLLPELMIHLAGVKRLKEKLLLNPADCRQEELSRLDSLIQSLEKQILLLED